MFAVSKGIVWFDQNCADAWGATVVAQRTPPGVQGVYVDLLRTNGPVAAAHP
jgi:hypothetical protein